MQTTGALRWKWFGLIYYEKIISWIVMITWYGRNGCNKEAIKLFEQMEYVGISLDDVTFVSVFSTYSHIGLEK